MNEYTISLLFTRFLQGGKLSNMLSFTQTYFCIYFCINKANELQHGKKISNVVAER